MLFRSVLAGQLHDIGKIGVEKEILCKQSWLNSEEFEKMANHPVIAWKILEPAGFLSEAREIILSHHERYDGKGYPRCLSGEEICVAGRILAVADTYDAMTSDRPYRRRLGKKDALSVIKREKGEQFDPAVVEAFLMAQKDFENRIALDQRLSITACGRVWEHSERLKHSAAEKLVKQNLKVA